MIPDSPPHPTEAKVKVPSIVGLVLAVLALLAAFGLDLTEVQQGAILGVVVALLPVVHFVAGFLAKHTPRPDLLKPGEVLTSTGQVNIGPSRHAAPGDYGPESRYVPGNSPGSGLHAPPEHP